MDRSFSINRVIADIVGVARTRWRPLLLVALVLGVGAGLAQDWLTVRIQLALAPSDGVLGMMNMAPRYRLGPMVVNRLIQLVLECLLIGAVLQIALRGGPRDLAGPFRTAVGRLPTILAAQAIVSAPLLLVTVLAGVLMMNPSEQGVRVMAFASTIAGVLSLAVFTFIGLASPSAISRDRKLWPAIRHSLWLGRERTLLLFGIYLAALLGQYAALWLIGTPGYELRAPLPLWARLLYYVPLQMLLWLGLAAVFEELRRLREPPAVEPTAEVFD